MKKVLYLIFLNLLVIVLVACASSDIDQESATPEPIPQQVEINVERMGNLITGIGKVKVYIDDEEVTKVGNNDTEKVNLKLMPGTHTIQTKGQGDKSDVVEFEVVEGANNRFFFSTEISSVAGVNLDVILADNDPGEMVEDTSSNEVIAEAVETEENNQEEADSPSVVSENSLDVIPAVGTFNTVESARDQISYVIYYYLQTYTSGDTSSLEYYVHKSSNFYSEQMTYMESLNSRGIILDLIDYDILSMEQVGDTLYKVIVEEYYTIDNPEKGFNDTQQQSEYTVELIDGDFFITSLEI